MEIDKTYIEIYLNGCSFRLNNWDSKDRVSVLLGQAMNVCLMHRELTQ